MSRPRKVLELLDLIARPLPRGRKFKLAIVREIREALKRLRQVSPTTRRNLDPFAHDFMASTWIYMKRRTLTWDEIDPSSRYDGIRERLALVRPKRFRVELFRSSDLKSGRVRNLLVRIPHSELQSAISTEKVRIASRDDPNRTQGEA